MSGWFSGVIVALLAGVLVLQLVVLRRLSREGRAPVGMRLDMVLRGQELLPGSAGGVGRRRSGIGPSSLHWRQEAPALWNGWERHPGRTGTGSPIRTDNDRRLRNVHC